ncbi:polysaccharide biosynthesis protein [Sediminispirochaeta smaragdinae]|uniref:Polysaccharide biosynthesis protein CapD n=1 Tax=Sediminispirochaeta smaragdinae (strain DSM 11293 / JCM 15392 / SEBR 4228) TaxID=573413 RepID=E1R437_SEDSS|nr:nucleoside-diphosphate sugar epimerase/dehydratase [Sediminispirochaeta smaragdinae]ADK80459.1 polysaccharide biosynthesis protein CapD [Sediminispirochaeta smaragdinae DSM 11293]
MSKEKRLAIVGAGFAGREIAGEIEHKGVFGKVVVFLDDDGEKVGGLLDGIPVEGPVVDAPEILKRNRVQEALIAVPGATGEQLRKIYLALKRADLERIRILPGISQIVDGDAHLIQTRELSAQDLLGRNPVLIPLKESLFYLRGKRVLITGAGGSIGGELARQLLSGGAQRLYLFDHGENNVYEIEKELRLLQEEGVGEAATIVPVIGDLKDRDYMHFIIKRLRADVIFHCAAYKHVPLTEANPVEGIKNNVFGTLNIVDAALEAGTSRFVLVSTDKAVAPSCVYGATKTIAEEIVLSRNGRGGGAFMVVRFGNVLASRGSIVPLFTKQILKGGPVTITDPKVSRFFMTIPEAASLVLKTGGVGEGGSLYILDMGEPLSIKELAEQMIRFYGYRPHEEIAVRYIGLRPGEKLTERLWLESESTEATDFPGILRLKRQASLQSDLEELLGELRSVCFLIGGKEQEYRNRKRLKEILDPHFPSLIPVPNEPEY